MNAPRSASLAVAILLTASVRLLAQQEQPPVVAGDRVRVSAPTLSLDQQVGTIVEMSANNWTLQYGKLDQTLSLSIGSLTKLEVSRGKKSNVLKGALGGFAVGVPAGAVIGLLGTTKDSPPGSTEAKFCDEGTLTCMALWGVAFGAVGGLVGLGIGAISRTDRWEEVPLERLHVGIASQGSRGLAISVRFAF